MERIRDRIILEHKDLLILAVSLENPQGWRISAWDVENKNTSQDRSVQLRMPSARLVIKLDISTVYARTRREPNRANLVQSPQDDDDTYIDEIGVRQTNPLWANMIKLVNHTEANRGGKHL